MTSKRAIIVGGGISGLALAYFLQRAGVMVTLVERAARTGGVIRTSRSDGFMVEHGPNSTLHKPGDEADALGRLMEALALQPRVANATASRRYVQKSGRLWPLPGSPGDFLRTPLFSPWAKLRLLFEPFHARAPEEESVAAFVRRRLGQEFLDWAIDPFVSGVYAGDPGSLSIRAAVPKIYALEARHGSLIRGALAMRQQGRISGMPKGRLISFDEGMEGLVATLRSRLVDSGANQVRIVTGVRDLDLVPSGSGEWAVQGSDGLTVRGDGVFLAIPANEAARLLRPLSTAAADDLAGIRHAPVVSMALGFDRDQVGHPLDGFGFLVPGREAMELLGCLFSSTLFPGRATAGQVLLTTFVGGMRHPTVAHRGEEELVAGVIAGLARALAIRGDPKFVQITRYEGAIAQYELGHLARLDRIHQALEPWPGLSLCGNYLGGVSVADRVRNSELLARGWVA
ncbi:MAG: protoporphyrinogen oxidase [Magnetococcales bacterium]|nr:protoporphyrinogen oxidase [Magnetococcales bacterium]MBF0149906.1 protoporphyrinogen oxidase [Magnetococcales bacterium]MBF0632011.1 protoporphyrinogen oxidase [Magnetococcales bacterium]